jgi:Protein of unknown function (DUF5661)
MPPPALAGRGSAGKCSPGHVGVVREVSLSSREEAEALAICTGVSAWGFGSFRRGSRTCHPTEKTSSSSHGDRLICAAENISRRSGIASGVAARSTFSADEARRIGEGIGIDWASAPFDVEQFRKGMDVELEHGRHDPRTNVTDDDEATTGKIALAHLNEFPDYYTRLEQMEEQARREHGAP